MPRSPAQPEDPPSPFRDGEAAAGYIAAMAGELSAIAQQHGLDTLGYLLDIVRLEAERSKGG